jgi:ABC-type transport system involved in multi-copper enzyme maturation permease subunit
MIWLTWRQHRLQAVTAAGVLLLLAIFLIVTGRQMTSYLHSTGLAACLARRASCDSLSQLFENRYGTLLNNIAYLNFLPLLAGMFWGAPLLAREYEQGTDILAWTQTVSRRRWLAIKLTAFIAAAIVAALSFSLLFGWWFGPFSQLAIHGGQSRIQPNVFDVQGIVPIGYTLFAFALGTAAGTLIRRTVPAMAVTAGAFFAARIGVQMLRTHLLTPLRSVHALVSPTGGVSLGTPLVGTQNWVLKSNVIDRSGHAVSDTTVLQTCRAIFNPRGMAQCITSHGYHQLDIYQPLSRYWPLQGIEFGAFTAVAVCLLAATAWAVTQHHLPGRITVLRALGPIPSRPPSEDSGHPSKTPDTRQPTEDRILLNP